MTGVGCGWQARSGLTRVTLRVGLLAVGLFAPPQRASAQSSRASATTPLRACCSEAIALAADRDTLVSVWRVAGNAGDATVALGDAASWRRTRLELTHDFGSSYRPQEAAQATRARLVADGGQRLGAWTMLGRVGYERRHEEGVHWRHHAEAYDGMQYSWADSVGGSFTRDVLSLGTTAASSAWRGWRVGLGVDYGLGQGARQNDPRPLSRRRVVELAPAATWQRARHQVGFGYRREWVREDLEIGGGSSTEYPVLFRLRGIATFDRTQLISGERAMLGRASGGTVGYAYRGGVLHVAVAGSGRRLVIDARDGIATPVTGGTSRITRYDGRLVARYATGANASAGADEAALAARGGIEVDVGMRRETSRGTDPVFGAVNAIDEGWAVPMTLTWWRGADPAAASWRVRASVESASLDRRDVASLAEWSVHSWRPGASVSHRLGTDGAWGVELSGGTTQVVATTLDVPRVTRVTDVLVFDDARLLQSSRWTSSIALLYDLRQGTTVRARARAAVGVLRHPSLSLSDRTARGRALWTFSWELL